MPWLNLRGAKRVSVEDAALKYERQLQKMQSGVGLDGWQSEDERRAQLHDEFMRKAAQAGVPFEDRDEAAMAAWDIAHGIH